MLHPPSQKTASVSSGMNAKKFLLRKDFAPDGADWRSYPDRQIGELHATIVKCEGYCSCRGIRYQVVSVNLRYQQASIAGFRPADDFLSSKDFGSGGNY